MARSGCSRVRDVASRSDVGCWWFQETSRVRGSLIITSATRRRRQTAWPATGTNRLYSVLYLCYALSGADLRLSASRFGSMTGGSCKLGLYDSGSFVAENVQNEGRGGTLSLR